MFFCVCGGGGGGVLTVWDMLVRFSWDVERFSGSVRAGS